MATNGNSGRRTPPISTGMFCQASRSEAEPDAPEGPVAMERNSRWPTFRTRWISSPKQIHEALQRFADGLAFVRRSPILHTPAEHGLEFEDVSFPALDGVPLEGWYIPAGSNKLIIANHPMGFSRSGIPTHLQPWHGDWAASGNGFEVDLVPDFKILHDAGYHVLAYDLRNHGMSSAANGGVCTNGVTESRDVVGSIVYVRARPDTKDLTIGLFSRCTGGNSTFRAMQRWPEAFDGIRCLVSPQPVTTRVIVESRLGVMGLTDHLEEFNNYVRLRASVGLEERVPQEWARGVRVPTFLYQVRADSLTDPSDVQAMFDNIPVADKRLLWIDGTTARWDGYLEFQRRPEPMRPLSSKSSSALRSRPARTTAFPTKKPVTTLRSSPVHHCREGCSVLRPGNFNRFQCLLELYVLSPGAPAPTGATGRRTCSSGPGAAPAFGS
jgi:hypothetical protein